MSEIESKDDFPLEKGDEFDDDQSSFVNKETTMRVVRRKPRDRFVQHRRHAEDIERERYLMDNNPVLGRRLMPKDGMRRNLEFPTEENPSDPMKMYRNPLNRYATSSGEDDAAVVRPLGNQKDDAEYSEYYDMNRVNSIKTKLPVLLRRTTTGKHFVIYICYYMNS